MTKSPVTSMPPNRATTWLPPPPPSRFIAVCTTGNTTKENSAKSVNAAINGLRLRRNSSKGLLELCGFGREGMIDRLTDLIERPRLKIGATRRPTFELDNAKFWIQKRIVGGKPGSIPTCPNPFSSPTATVTTMAKTATSGKKLVIVESPAKARTISKFLGNDYIVEASIGHIRDLPAGKKEVPEKYKQEPWAYLGVNTDDHFEPLYIVPAEKKKQVKKLRDALKQADELYLATDEDREGEAISWHLHETLKPKIPVHRLVFHEITREAIQKALSSTRQIDQHLVQAQETRRILDRLYGFDMSNLMWRKVGKGTSAGRVQSVAVRLVVDRERQRMAFVSSTYWDLEATFKTDAGGDRRRPQNSDRERFRFDRRIAEKSRTVATRPIRRHRVGPAARRRIVPRRIG